uniref:Uncharacterized protein n=1 Tax=Curvibacter symbiont subsp. Hydra magnipapillata TaxID=667019 RepID=C9Y8X7_CURXX|nr:hypothetical protein Csp_A05780 [Curvibacter putative symbiont of Hydra magnipapillata]
MTDALKKGRRIEVRKFGILQTKVRSAVVYRNSRTGEKLQKRQSKVVHFKEGKNLRMQLLISCSNL